LKLLDFFEDPLLTELRLRMSARLIPEFESRTLQPVLSAQEIAALGHQGIELKDLDLVKVEDDDTLSYKGYRVAIYIRDHGLMREEHTLPVFHVAFCQTVESMKENKRLFRYAVTNQEDENFTLNWIGERTIQFSQRLTVCQKCLSTLHWDHFDAIEMSQEEQFSILFSFSLKDYFSQYPKKIHKESVS